MHSTLLLALSLLFPSSPTKAWGRGGYPSISAGNSRFAFNLPSGCLEFPSHPGPGSQLPGEDTNLMDSSQCSGHLQMPDCVLDQIRSSKSPPLPMEEALQPCFLDSLVGAQGTQSGESNKQARTCHLLLVGWRVPRSMGKGSSGCLILYGGW